ncbi:MobA-like NTP transferase domain protein [compost metagenome]
MIFDASVFEDLRRADPAVGAKAVFAKHRDRIVNVAVDDPGAFSDMDTPEDFEKIQRS